MKYVCRPRRLNSLFVLISLSALSAACGSGEDKSDGQVAEAPPRGTISRIDGKVRLLTQEEERTVCKTQHCEPDFSYHETLAKKRVKPPEGNVVTPVPLEGMPSDAIGERHDYGKQKMRLYDAWAISRGSPAVVVAIIDSGLDITHPDLQGNLWVNQAEATGLPGVDDDHNGYVDDVHGWDFVADKPITTGDTDHGTHVAGIIAAAINGQGTAGVAPRVKVMALKFISSSGNGYTSDAVAAMEYAVANGASVINNSWGGSSYSSYLEGAVADAVSSNVVFVAASGNNGKNTDSSGFYPANYSGVVSVGSTDESDQLSSFSNYGVNTVEVAAPGSNIYSTLRYGGYGTISGTSMAAPQVSGALALGFSLRGDLPSSVVRQKLCESAVPLFPTYIKCGRIDVASYLQKLSSVVR